MTSAPVTTPLGVCSIRSVFDVVLEFLTTERLQIQADVGDVFHHAGNRRELVLHALNLRPRDGGTFQARQQNPPQAVRQRMAEASLERLRHKHPVRVVSACPVREQRDWAVPNHASEYA